MIRSQAVALRCAAALPSHLLYHRRRDERRYLIKERYGLTHRQAQGCNKAFIDQLCRCKNEMARRILLGVSR